MHSILKATNYLQFWKIMLFFYVEPCQAKERRLQQVIVHALMSTCGYKLHMYENRNMCFSFWYNINLLAC